MRKKKQKIKLGTPEWADTDLDADERGKAAWQDYLSVEHDYATFEQERIDWHSLYNDVELLPTMSRRRTLGKSFYSRIKTFQICRKVSKENVLRSVVKTLLAGITTFKPRIKFEVEGGNGLTELKSEFLQAYVDTLFRTEKIYSSAISSFEDALTDIFGALKLGIDPQTNKLNIDYASSFRILVPGFEYLQHSKDVPELFYVSEVRLSELHAMYPEPVEEYLEKCGQDNKPIDTSETVMIVERWHVKTNNFPGRYSCFWQHGELTSDEWGYDFVPFVFCFYGRNKEGMFGIPLVQELMPMQEFINDCNNAIEIAMKQSAIQKIFVPTGANIIDDEINNIFNTIIHGNQPPQVLPSVASNVIQDYMSQKKDTREQMYRIAGVSEANATGVKPAGLNSGEAQRQYQEQVSRRFAPVEEVYSDMFLDIAQMAIKLQKETYKSNRKLYVQAISKNLPASNVTWKDIDMDMDSFTLVLNKASNLPTEAAARVQMANEMIQQGGWDPEEAYALVEFHNAGGLIATKNVMYRAIRAFIERYLEDGIKYTDSLPPAFDPVMAMKLIDDRTLMEHCCSEPSLDKLDKLADLRMQALSMIPAPPAQATQEPIQQQNVGLPSVEAQGNPGAQAPMQTNNLSAAPVAPTPVSQ